LLRSVDPLRSYPRRFTEYLTRWARERPDAVWLAQRDANGEWRKLCYSAAFARIQSLAAGLLQRELSAERPLVILSGNSIEHALLAFAAMHVGVPVAPLSPAYSLVDPEARRILHAISLLTPGLVYAEDAGAFDRSVSLAVPARTEVVALHGHFSSRNHTPFESLMGTASLEVERA
jgi:feruloyl-CoA synthase